VAETTMEAYPDGVWLVELEPLADPALLPHAIAAALGIREQADSPVATTLKRLLQQRRMLLVLDNCEHLAPACA